MRMGSRMLAVLAAMAGATSPIAAGQALAAAKPVVGAPAPDFKITTFDGKTLRLADFKGQVLALNFWATWCGPCKRELPMLDAYYRIQQKFGLRVFAVTTEDSVPVQFLGPLSKAMAIPLARRMHGAYDYPDGVPTTYVIDRAGVLRYAKAGALTLDDMNALFVPLLQEPAPPPAPDAAPPPAPPSPAPPSPAPPSVASTGG